MEKNERTYPKSYRCEDGTEIYKSQYVYVGGRVFMIFGIDLRDKGQPAVYVIPPDRYLELNRERSSILDKFKRCTRVEMNSIEIM